MLNDNYIRQSADELLRILQRDADGCAMRILQTPPFGRDNEHFARQCIITAMKEVARIASLNAIAEAE